MGFVLISAGGGPITVTVVDESDWTGWVASATRFGEHAMTNVQTMVDVVIAASATRKIARLNILDHGNSDGFEVGTDWVTLNSLSRYSDKLGQLRGRFAEGGYVHLQGCNVGMNLVLLQRMADLWNVKVVAGTGLQNPVYRVNTGRFVECVPNGPCRRSSDQWGAIGYH
jgi:hypothetical protein